MTSYLDDPNYQTMLRSVLATPADMAPRYGFADWLLEHPDPVAQHRGRAILASLGGKSVARRDALVLLGGLERHFEHWRVTSSLSPLIEDDTPWRTRPNPHSPSGSTRVGQRVTFQLRNGFVYRMGLYLTEWMKLATTVFAYQPITEAEVWHGENVLCSKRTQNIYVGFRRSTKDTLGIPTVLWPYLRRAGDWTLMTKKVVGIGVGTTRERWYFSETDQVKAWLGRAVILYGRRKAGLESP